MKNPSYITNIYHQTITLEGVVYHRENLHMIPDDELRSFLREWFNSNNYIEVQTSGSTGEPKIIQARKQQLINSACMTCDFLGLSKGDKTLLCMSLKYIGAKMIVIRSLVAGLNLIIREASGHPLQTIHSPLDFAAMVPLQVYNSLQTSEEKEKLKQIKNLIIGGGAIDPVVEKEIQAFPHAVYSTYGMTETLSHIALRRLNGPGASPFYTPFSGIHLSLSPEDTLIIDAPMLSPEVIRTNDLAEILPDGKFIIMGRKDNIINTGGIKIQIEELEALIKPFIPYPFAITGVPDKKFGELVVLLVETTATNLLKTNIPVDIPIWSQPKKILSINKLPITGNGKTNRLECKKLASEIIKI